MKTKPHKKEPEGFAVVVALANLKVELASIAHSCYQVDIVQPCCMSYEIILPFQHPASGSRVSYS